MHITEALTRVAGGFGRASVECLDDTHRRYRGLLANICDGEIHVDVLEDIPVPSAVRVWFAGDCWRAGDVLFCVPVDVGYRVGITFAQAVGIGQREEERTPLENAPAVVRLLEGPCSEHSGEGTDISSSGVGLRVLERLPVGTWVKIEFSFAIAYGEIRYCHPAAEGQFRVGVRAETILHRGSVPPAT